MDALSPSGDCPQLASGWTLTPSIRAVHHATHQHLHAPSSLARTCPKRAPHGELSPEDQRLVLNLPKEVEPPIAESCQR